MTSADTDKPYAEDGGRLRRARKALGYKQGEAAQISGITQQRWYNYEAGIRSPGIDAVRTFCNKTGLTMDYVFRGVMTGLPQDLSSKIIEMEKTGLEPDDSAL